MKTYRALMYGTLLFIYFFVFFHRLSSAVVKFDLEMDFGLTGMQYSLMGSMYFYAYMLMQIPGGILIDSTGPRRSVSLGCLVMSLGSILFGLAQNIPILMLGRLLVGLGASVILLSVLKVQSYWFKASEFATLTGLSSLVGNLGGAVAQAPLAAMVARFTWRSTFISVGTFTLLLALLAWLLIRDMPQELGFAPIADLPYTTGGQNNRAWDALKMIIKDRNMWLMLVGNMIIAGTGYAFSAWNVAYLSSVYALDTMEAGSITFWQPLALGAGALALGIISNSMKKRRTPMLIFVGLNLVCWGILAFVKLPLWMMYLFIPVLGFVSGSVTLSFTIAKEINNPQFAAVSTSFVNMGIFAGGSVFPVLFGAIMDHYGSMYEGIALYQNAFRWLFGFILLALFLVSMYPETNGRNLFIESRYNSSLVPARKNERGETL